MVVYFLALGFALVRFDAAAGSSPTRLAIWAMALGPLLWTARNAYTVFLRPAVWGVLLVLVARGLSRILGARTGLPPAEKKVWSGPNLPLSAKEGAL